MRSSAATSPKCDGSDSFEAKEDHGTAEGPVDEGSVEMVNPPVETTVSKCSSVNNKIPHHLKLVSQADAGTKPLHPRGC